MSRFLIVLLTLAMNMQAAHAINVDAFMDKHIAPVSDAIAAVIFHPVHFFGTDVPIIIFWILIAGVFFTFYLRGIAIWGFKHAVDILAKPADKDGDSGEVSSFQALMTALSGTIGLGSIAGVAIAISMGGPGAAFWILVGAILGMSLKFVEAALAVKYRRFNLDGSISGGPMHYMAHGLTRKKLRWLGQPLSVVFAVLCICGGITGGNMIQINQAASQFVNVTGGEHSILYGFNWVIGLVMAIVVGMIVIGGIKSIVKVTEKIVPLKIFLYLFAAVIVIVANFKLIPHAAGIIIREAFQPQAIYGGAFVAMIMGLRRSVQSNEAGTGSAPIAYATVKTSEPLTQGFVALLEPFLTGIMCMLTAFAIVITGVYSSFGGETSGIEMTSAAFTTVLPYFEKILAGIVLLYALSTLISWAYYGQKSWNFLFGEGQKRTLTFQFIYCAFVVIGSVLNVTSVINITDAMMIAMSIPNIIAMYILAPEIKKDLAEYCRKYQVGKFINRDWLAMAPAAAGEEKELCLTNT
ncbi:MAG: alanine:cation symporter family protein [Heliobacteriaceae bacterium]|jgi:AGCS family alanine or glycine:cation symporter|nr:alanine:cation symporter family protein [Heliobacteriaceae bacterium]